MRTRRPPRTCAHKACLLKPTSGQWCYFHAKVMAGLCDAGAPNFYPDAQLVGVRRSVLARLRAEAMDVA